MPLTTHLIAGYTENINHLLSKIPIEQVEDFDMIQQALQNLIAPNCEYLATFKKLPASTQEHIFCILEHLDYPEDYVKDAKDYKEYQDILEQRIYAQITEFGLFSDTKKQNYIDIQRSERATVMLNHAEMRKHQPPGRGEEAHVLPERLEGVNDPALPRYIERYSRQEIQGLIIMLQIMILQKLAEQDADLSTREQSNPAIYKLYEYGVEIHMLYQLSEAHLTAIILRGTSEDALNVVDNLLRSFVGYVSNQATTSIRLQ